jgi:hypothetical protein
MTWRIAGEGRLTVSERRSITTPLCQDRGWEPISSRKKNVDRYMKFESKTTIGQLKQQASG